MKLKEAFEILARENMSDAQISRDTKINSSYISQMKNGAWSVKLSDSAKANHEAKIIEFAKGFLNKSLDEYSEVTAKAGLLDFTNTHNMMATLAKCRIQKNMTYVSAPSGSGKTKGIEAFANGNPSVVIVTAYDGLSAKDLLEDVYLAFKKDAEPPKNVRGLMSGILRELKGSVNRLLVIDEANFIKERSLEQLRHIHDRTNIAITLVGTEKLKSQIEKYHPQVKSRIRNGLPIEPFGVEEVRMMCVKYGIFSDKAEMLLKKKRNMREIEYFLQDALEYRIEDFETAMEELR